MINAHILYFWLIVFALTQTLTPHSSRANNLVPAYPVSKAEVPRFHRNAEIPSIYLPLSIDGFAKSKANCNFLLGGGNGVFGAKFTTNRVSYTTSRDSGIFVDLSTEKITFLDQYFDQNHHVLGFDPSGEWLLVSETRDYQNPLSAHLYKFDLKTLAKTPLNQSNGSSHFTLTNEAISKNGKYFLTIQPDHDGKALFSRWDMSGPHPKALEFLRSPTSKKKQFIYNPMISDDGNTILYNNNGFHVLKISSSGKIKHISLAGAPYFLSTDGSLVLTRHSPLSFKLTSISGDKPVDIPLKNFNTAVETLAKAAGPLVTIETIGRSVKFKSAQFSKDKRLAIELEYEQIIDSPQNVGVAVVQQLAFRNALLIWDLTKPNENPLFIKDHEVYDFPETTYQLIEGGRLMFIGATEDQLIFMDPNGKKEAVLPYRSLIPDFYKGVWALELSNDLKRLALANHRGILIIDLSKIIR